MPITYRASVVCSLLIACIQLTSAQTTSPAPQARKITEIDAATSVADITARLDEFAAAVKNEAGSRGLLFYYSGTTLPGAAFRLKAVAERYLRLNGNVPLGSMMGSDRPVSTVELWLIPDGASRPRPTPTPVAKDYTNAFVWDEMNYFLRSERKGLKEKDQLAFNSNFYYSQDEWLDSYAMALTFPQHPRGVLMIFPKRGDPPDIHLRIAEYQKRYLYRAAGIDASRLAVSTPATFSETRKVQLWLMPGAGPLIMGSFAPTERKTVSQRLDEVVATMRSLTGLQSGSTLYIIAYSGACEGDYGKQLRAATLLAEMKQYLLKQKQLLAKQMVLIDGGVMDKCEVESWLLPPGATLFPKPKLPEP